MIADAESTRDEGTRDEVYGMLAELFIRPPGEDMASRFVQGAVAVDTLAVEFTTLLRGIRDTSPPPPYESLYREGVLNGDCTMDVMDAYRAFDVRPVDDLEGEPPDHISFELDFMRLLCTREGEARTDAELLAILEAEGRFLSSHLTTWAGRLREEIEQADTTGFYSELAAFTDRWIETDHQLVQDRLLALGVER